MQVIICGSPYQVIIALHLKNTEWQTIDVDIYILDHFSGAKEVANKLRNMNSFHEVIFSEVKFLLDSFSPHRIIRVPQRFHMYKTAHSKIVRKHFGYKDQVYTDVYYSFPDLIIKLALKAFWKRNKSLKIHLFEDGTGGYFPLPHHNARYNDIFYKLTGVSHLVWHYDSIRVFKPKLLYKTDVPVKSLGVISDDIDFKNRLNLLFNFSESDRVSQQNVLFEQPNFFAPQVDDVIKKIMQPYLGDNTLVKLHPRTKHPERYAGFPTHVNIGLPWEVICMNSDISGKTLISLNSTSLFTPKLLFDIEPRVVFLFNIPEVKEFYSASEQFHDFVKRFKSIYRDTTRVFIPTSVDELNEIMQIVE